MRRFALIVALALVPSAASADDRRPDPRVDVQGYRYALELTDASDVIHGVARIDALVAPALERLELDLVAANGDTGMTVHAVRVDGAGARYEHSGDHLRVDLPDTATEDGRVRVVIEYDGVPADGLVIGHNLHGDRTFFGDNYPNRARNWIPAVDHPADKATVEWTVTAPDHYQVVGSGRLVEETDLGDGRRRTVWRSGTPMATKVMVIGVAPFAVRYLGDTRGVPVQSWVYPQDRDTGFRALAVAPRILDFYVDWIGPFPYAKLANVQSKTRYGGMENAGNIFYSERAVASGRDLESLLAHEIAHQWFGDAVSEADWHHVWLSEGFATYFTQLYLEHTYGAKRLRQGMAGAREAVLRFDADNPDSPVIDEGRTVEHILSTNAYQKGAWVLHMLRNEIGDEAFHEGIRAYYRRYRDGNALTGDFRDVMEQASGRDLHSFFAQWTERPGQPTLTGGWSWQDGVLHVHLRQAQDGAPFDVDVDLGVEAGDGTTTVHRLELSERTADVSFAVAERPARVRLDPDVRLLFRAGRFVEASSH